LFDEEMLLNHELWTFLAFIVAYVVLTKWVLPKFGVAT
jgi:hypothetical protein